MFNDARSGINETIRYNIFENIKDGRQIAYKYSREIIKFKTPNFVTVSSNAVPDMNKLSKDRLKVFSLSGI